jgi:hypothetical protein
VYDELHELIAYGSGSGPPVRVAPAGRRRDWIDEMGDRWAYRCLPLVLASEAGWVLLNPFSFEASWNGDSGTSGVSIRFDVERSRDVPVQSHFGYGIMTWAVPFLFRTPPGWNLLVRGPANWPKDGIAPLEGLVETDWSVATFTMNWKFTRPGHTVRFEADEPFCMVVPQRRGALEAFRPVFRELGTESELAAATRAWADSRHESHVRKFLGEYSKEYESELSSWQQHYYRGEAPDGRRAPEHQTRLRLAEFTGESEEQSS